MKRCAFLTLDEVADFVIDDELAYEPFRAIGWEVEAVPWRRHSASSGRFDAVVIRSPWDYQQDPEAFLAVLSEVERAGVPLFNSIDVVRWNLRKTYLRELAARGVGVPPTLWRDRLAPGEGLRLFDELGAEEIVLKPVVGANADGAFRLDRQAAADRRAELEAFYADRPLIAQPFAHSVLREGEYSLIYFGGTLSHAITKTPKSGDFRSQEEHGGMIRAIEPDEELLAAGEVAIRAIPPTGAPPLYARVDLVRANGGAGYWLMELELIEPALYLRMDPAAPVRFAEAFAAAVGEDRPIEQ